MSSAILFFICAPMGPLFSGDLVLYLGSDISKLLGEPSEYQIDDCLLSVEVDEDLAVDQLYIANTGGRDQMRGSEKE